MGIGQRWEKPTHSWPLEGSPNLPSAVQIASPKVKSYTDPPKIKVGPLQFKWPIFPTPTWRPEALQEIQNQGAGILGKLSFAPKAQETHLIFSRASMLFLNLMDLSRKKDVPSTLEGQGTEQQSFMLSDQGLGFKIPVSALVCV